MNDCSDIEWWLTFVTVVGGALWMLWRWMRQYDDASQSYLVLGLILGVVAALFMFWIYIAGHFYSPSLSHEDDGDYASEF